MSTIHVLFYGYKSKELPEAVSSLIENQSGQNHVSVVVFDQINVGREQKFDGLQYAHIHWDNRKSPFLYLEDVLENTTSDFFLYINGAIKFEKNWDMELVMGHGGNNVVISGNHNILFDNTNHKFYPQYTKHMTNTASVTNWVSSDFIFMKTEDFRKFPKLSEHIKYMGIEEVYSAFAVYNKMFVQSIATAWATRIDDTIFAHDYHPFSLKHGYNKVIKMLQKKENVFFNDLDCINGLSQATGFDFDKLSLLPFAHDDAYYDPVMEMDSVGEERFISNVRVIR